jgi:hypothetical protein
MKKLLALVVVLAGCAKDPAPTEAPPEVPVPSSKPSDLPGHGSLAQDNTPKEGPRLLPAEVYIQAYLDIFGGLSPLAAELASRGKEGSALFDTWRDYVASLGLPDYEKDLSRLTQTNAMMLATFERIGIALCDRAAERELDTTPRPALDKRTVFAFEPTTAAPTEAEFAQRFDVMHRTFLGYPAALAETPRVKRFYDLYKATVAKHSAPGAAASGLSAANAGWAAVCYGLVRHPEFHTY